MAIDDAMTYFNETKELGIKGTTVVYNNCLWACDNAGRYQEVMDLLDRMEHDNINWNEESYAACTMAFRWRLTSSTQTFFLGNVI